MAGSIQQTATGYLHTVEDGDKKAISVERLNTGQSLSVLPTSNDVVTCKVTSVNPRQVKVQILSVAGKRLPQHFRGVYSSNVSSFGNSIDFCLIVQS